MVYSGKPFYITLCHTAVIRKHILEPELKEKVRSLLNIHHIPFREEYVPMRNCGYRYDFFIIQSGRRIVLETKGDTAKKGNTLKNVLTKVRHGYMNRCDLMFVVRTDEHNHIRSLPRNVLYVPLSQIINAIQHVED